LVQSACVRAGRIGNGLLGRVVARVADFVSLLVASVADRVGGILASRINVRRSGVGVGFDHVGGVVGIGFDVVGSLLGRALVASAKAKRADTQRDRENGGVLHISPQLFVFPIRARARGSANTPDVG
jgi:hypothetical protein